MISGGWARRLGRQTPSTGRSAARKAGAAGVVLAAAVALLSLGIGSANALQADPPPAGSSPVAGAAAPTVELIPAVSATIVAPAPGVAIELIPAASATLDSAHAGARVLPAAAYLHQKAAAAGDSGATTISEGSVSIELIPATSSEIAPTPPLTPADSTAVHPAGSHISRAQADHTTGAAAPTTAAQATRTESVSVLAEASSVAPAAAGHTDSNHETAWILAAAIVVLLGVAVAVARLLRGRTRRQVRH